MNITIVTIQSYYNRKKKRLLVHRCFGGKKTMAQRDAIEARSINSWPTDAIRQA
jgi:hypothetical protein